MKEDIQEESQKATAEGTEAGTESEGRDIDKTAPVAVKETAGRTGPK